MRLYTDYESIEAKDIPREPQTGPGHAKSSTSQPSGKVIHISESEPDLDYPDYIDELFEDD